MNIVISGFYGLGNTGDEAILDAVIHEIRRKDPQAGITVFSLSPEQTASRHGVESVYRGWRRSNKEKIRALRKADVLISGGGGLLQDVYSTKIIGGPLPYYLLIALLARLCGTGVMFFSQGIGPVTSRYGRFLMATLGNLPSLITVRDEESKTLAKALGIRRPIEVTADVVFALPFPDSTDEGASFPDRVAGKKRLGISVRPWFQDTHHYDAVASAVDHYLALGYDVIMIPMEGHHDVRASDEVRKRLTHQKRETVHILDGSLTPEAYLKAIGSCDVLIGMRLHALIFAILAGVPHTAISYDPKVSQLMKRTGLSRFCLPFASLDGETLTTATDELMQCSDHVTQEITKMRTTLQNEARNNIERLYETFQPKN